MPRPAPGHCLPYPEPAPRAALSGCIVSLLPLMRSAPLIVASARDHSSALQAARGRVQAGRSGAVAAFPFAAAAAGARVVASAPCVLRDVGPHELGGCPASTQQPCHGFDRPPDVIEELLVARAQVMLPWLAVRRGREPVLGTAAVAGEPYVAVAAELGQGVVLVLPNLRWAGEVINSSMGLSLMFPSR